MHLIKDIGSQWNDLYTVNTQEIIDFRIEKEFSRNSGEKRKKEIQGNILQTQNLTWCKADKQ